MCGRFALATEKHILEMLYQLEFRDELLPSYNIAPSQEILACRISPVHGARELVSLKWGLVPFWAKDETMAGKMINARSETASDKPSFRTALKNRRLLIPVSGFFEWKAENGAKQPYYICRRDGSLFSLAGLWERWEKATQVLESCTILTTEPNSLVAELHNRMPVIIPEQSYGRWLDPETHGSELQDLQKPYPPKELTFYPVSRLVNSPHNNSAELIKPL